MSEKVKLPDLNTIKNLNIGDNSEIIKTFSSIKKEEEPQEEKVLSLPRDKRSRKFNFSEPSIIDLPSRGLLYNSTDPDIRNGKIKLYPMTLKDEEILSTKLYIEDGTSIYRVLNNCIASDIPVEEILNYDYSYLLFYLRKISYGDVYQFETYCPYCKTKQTLAIKISDIKFDELPEGTTDPTVIDLPKSKYSVIMKFPRVKDLLSFKPEERITVVSALTERIISIIDNTGKELPREEYEEFINAIPVEDADVLIDKSILMNGIDKIMQNFTCINEKCGKTIGGSIPITESMFRISK
jgi:hypothetical protein